jgi:hypothetical protein
LALEREIVSRNQYFDAIPKLSTRILAGLKSSGVTGDTLAYARSLNRRLLGKSPVTSKPSTVATAEIAAGNEEQRVSMVQASFEARATFFAELVSKLTTEALYKPNEADIQVAALTSLAQALRDRNKAVADAEIRLDLARIARNKVLFQQLGVHDTAIEIKEYIKSVFGRRSEQYRQLGELKFQKRK